MIQIVTQVHGHLPTREEMLAMTDRGIAKAGHEAQANARGALGGRLVRRRTGRLQASAALRFASRGDTREAIIGPFWFTGRFIDKGTRAHPITPTRFGRRRRGVVTRTGQKDRFGRAIVIRNRGARHALRFNAGGGFVFAASAQHPGIRPRGWLRVVEGETNVLATRIFEAEAEAMIIAASTGPARGA